MYLSNDVVIISSGLIMPRNNHCYTLALKRSDFEHERLESRFQNAKKISCFFFVRANVRALLSRAISDTGY